jgi:protein-L-isoaspartate(D-aspartate) O-methyltransferase
MADAQPLPWPESGNVFEQRRRQMVSEQLVARGVRDECVLRAMGLVPREEFVAPDFRAEAYHDSPLPIGHGQTISQPYTVAYMLEA